MCTGNCEIMNNKLALHNISCQLLDMFTYRTFENCPPMKGIMKMLICSNSEKPYFKKNSIYVLNIIYGVTNTHYSLPHSIYSWSSNLCPRSSVLDSLSSTLMLGPVSLTMFLSSFAHCATPGYWLLTVLSYWKGNNISDWPHVQNINWTRELMDSKF